MNSSIYDMNSDGYPTASHKWEEQFRIKGERSGMPPAERLVERIAQLEAAMANAPVDKIRKGWALEVVWRKRQLETIRSIDGDS